MFIARSNSLLCYLHVTGYPSRPIIHLWAWCYLVAQTGLESWLRGPNHELLTKSSIPQSGWAIGGSRNPLGTCDWLLGLGWTLLMCCAQLSRRCRRVQYYMLRLPSVVCLESGFSSSPSELLIKDQSTKYRASTIHLRPRTLVGTPPREASVQDFILRGYLKRSSFRRFLRGFRDELPTRSLKQPPQSMLRDLTALSALADVEVVVLTGKEVST